MRSQTDMKCQVAGLLEPAYPEGEKKLVNRKQTSELALSV